MATNPVRVPAAVHSEVLTAARVLGCSAAELLERAWEEYRQSPAFREEFEQAQKAFSVGDLDHLATWLTEKSSERARRRAAAVSALREEPENPD
jgi:hypothetical protein